MNAELLKLKISSTLTNKMLRLKLTPKELASQTKIAQHRVFSLLNPTDTVVDFVVLCKVCSVLRIQISINRRVAPAATLAAKEMPHASIAHIPWDAHGVPQHH